MSYVDDLAAVIRESIAPDLLPEGDTATLFRIYALLVMAKGEGVTLENVHDAWAAWMSGENAKHPSLRPLAELPAEVQYADQPYLDAIRAVARERDLTPRGVEHPAVEGPIALCRARRAALSVWRDVSRRYHE